MEVQAVVGCVWLCVRESSDWSLAVQGCFLYLGGSSLAVFKSGFQTLK